MFAGGFTLESAQAVLSETEGTNVSGTDPDPAIKRLRSELDNLREAFRIAMDTPAHGMAARLIAHLRDLAQLAVVDDPRVWATELLPFVSPERPLFSDICALVIEGALAKGDTTLSFHLAEMIETMAESGSAHLSTIGLNSAGDQFWFSNQAEPHLPRPLVAGRRPSAR